LGVGDVSDERMAGAAATIAESFELPRVPKPADVFSRDFLPAKADRMPTVLSN
jgi:NitT/TauT family transport system substrate-binding protein